MEGLTIAYGTQGTGYLIASSQGDNTFAVYRREGNNAHVKQFAITASSTIDEVSVSDGIHVTTRRLGPGFPHGVFVAHDDDNDDGNQNYKLVPHPRAASSCACSVLSSLARSAASTHLPDPAVIIELKGDCDRRPTDVVLRCACH